MSTRVESQNGVTVANTPRLRRRLEIDQTKTDVRLPIPERHTVSLSGPRPRHREHVDADRQAGARRSGVCPLVAAMRKIRMPLVSSRG